MPSYITNLSGGTAGWFVDQNNNPRMFLADECWGLPANAGVTAGHTWQQDIDAYLTARAAQGFTVITVDPYGDSIHGGNDNGTTLDGVAPFTTPFSVFNETFWTRIDYLITQAAALGLTINLDVAYTYHWFTGHLFDGMTTGQGTGYGTTLGNRYKTTPNLLWMFGDDYSQTSDAVFTAIADAIIATGDTHEMTIEYYPSGTTSREDLSGSPTATPFTWGAAYATFNWVYYYWVTYFGIEQAYKENSQIPIVWGDGWFWGGESGTMIAASDKTSRYEAWWAMASGARGVSVGSHFVFPWNSSSLAAVTSEGWYATGAGAMRTAIESLTGWNNLVPDLTNALVTGGRGTRAAYSASNWSSDAPDTYVAASLVPDGSLALLYLPQATTITIDQSKLAAGYIAKWIDPVNGATSVATVGSTYNSTAKGINSVGDPDWALALLAPPYATWTVV